MLFLEAGCAFLKLPQIANTRIFGYLKIEKQGIRRGDYTQMATISFVDDISTKEESPVAKKKPAAKPKAAPTAKKTPAKKTEEAK